MTKGKAVFFAILLTIIVVIFYCVALRIKVDINARILQISANPDNMAYSPDVVETSRSAALLYMQSIKNKGLKILDFGGATQGHLHYADTVADMRDHSSWYKKYFPGIKFVPGADIQHKLPFADNEFDYVWTSHVAEHVPNPELFCADITRISKYGGVICVPRPLADNFLELREEEKYGHKWWILHNDTFLQFMPRQKLLIHDNQKEARNYNNFMRSFFSSSWEMCVVFRNPLRCDIIKPIFVDWSKSSNILPLIYQNPMKKNFK